MHNHSNPPYTLHSNPSYTLHSNQFPFKYKPPSAEALGGNKSTLWVLVDMERDLVSSVSNPHLGQGKACIKWLFRWIKLRSSSWSSNSVLFHPNHRKLNSACLVFLIFDSFPPDVLLAEANLTCGIIKIMNWVTFSNSSFCQSDLSNQSLFLLSHHLVILFHFLFSSCISPPSSKHIKKQTLQRRQEYWPCLLQLWHFRFSCSTTWQDAWCSNWSS